VARVSEVAGLYPGDELLAVGSLVEGLGSCKSDLDLLLVTPRAEQLLPAEEHVATVAGRCLMDILVLPSARLEALFARFAAWARLPWNVIHAVTFTIAERTVMHRLVDGRALFRAPEWVPLPLQPSTADLARLKLHVSRQNARTIQVDMVGYRDEHDYHSLVFAAQTLLGDATDALLAGFRVTNPLAKWRSRFLQTLPPQWESALPGRMTGMTASELLWQLHRAPSEPTRTASIEHAQRATTFARRVFSWAERQLVDRPDRSDGPVSLARVAEAPLPIHDMPLPYLDFDVDYVWGDGVATLGRLNDFGQTLTLSPREFAACLFFDGMSTVQEAASAAYGHDSPEDAARVAAVRERLVAAGLVEPAYAGAAHEVAPIRGTTFPTCVRAPGGRS
jgi:hypothetical protein